MSGILEMPLEKFQRIFIDSVPHYRVLNFALKERGAGRIVYSMPYAPSLTGNPETGEIHEFAIVTLIDATCTTAIQTRLDRFHRTATLDLRTDFIRKSRPGNAILCEADCLSLDANIATLRAAAHEGDPADPMVIATAAFAIIPIRPTNHPA
jgi:acyl-coenzyme A thioesterase PaaI-like protein